MEKKRKRHFNVGEVKTQILEYMLQHDTPVKELELTEHLKNEYSEFNRASVNRHLRDLENLKCVSKVTPVKKSRFNYWDIEFKNLKSIENEFSDIQLSDYTKAKDKLIKGNFPDIRPRLYKKYFVHMSLFPSLFDIFFKSEFELMLKRADELWQIEDYRDIIDSKIGEVYNVLFLVDGWMNPPNPIIEVSKEEFQTVLNEIQYIYKEETEEEQKETIKQNLLNKLTEIIISKRPNSTKDQVKKEVLEKIINHIWRPYQDLIDDIIHYQELKRYKIYDKVCKHFYETDFLIGNTDEDAKFFIDELEKRIEKVNEAFNKTPSSEETRPIEKLQAAIDELDSLYDEWYEKYLQKEK